MAQLVIQTAFPGDLLLSIPLLKQIRRFYPQDSIVLICRVGLGDFFRREGLVDEVIEVNKKDYTSAKKVRTEIQSRDWSRIFCPHESFRTALWVRSLRANEFSVGFEKWWNFWAFSKRVRKPMHLPDALRQLSLLKAVNADFDFDWKRDLNETIVNSKSRTDIELDAAIPEWATMSLYPQNANGEKIFIAPGSVWPTKMWTKEGFCNLAKSLAVKGFSVVIVGSPSEQSLCEEIAREAGVESWAGKTSLSDLIGHFRNGKVLVSNDSGAMHAAAVAGLPTVSIFGPTVLEFGFRPWQQNAVVVQKDLSCRPCAAHGGKKCPIGTHACMREIPFTQVEAAVLQKVQTTF